jgi:ATP-dependent DNA ligase
MLACAGKIPSAKGWAFEPKLDGFRALASIVGYRPRGGPPCWR